MVNVDLFLDALRGEMSVGRSRTLDQLYTLLLKQVGKPTESLSTSWIQFHLEKIAAQRIRPRELGQFPPEDLMAALFSFGGRWMFWHWFISMKHCSTSCARFGVMSC